MNVLLVEDNPLDAGLVEAELNRRKPGWKLSAVRRLAGARAALASASALPDVILADLRLPDGSGMDLLAHVRGTGLPVAVVILTGDGDETSVLAALHAGADDYITKREDYLQHLPATLEAAAANFREQQGRHARPLRILYAEPHADDAALTVRELKRVAPHLEMHIVLRPEEVLAAVSAPAGQLPDLILLDYQLPGMLATELIKELRQRRGLRIPIVVVTGFGGEGVARLALRMGAADYVLKNPGYIHRLPSVIERAFYMEEAQHDRRELAIREERYHQLSERLSHYMRTSPTITYALALTPDGVRMVWVSENVERILGYSIEEALSPGWWDHWLFPPDRPTAAGVMTRLLDEGHISHEYRFTHKDGSILWLQDELRIHCDENGKPVEVVGTWMEITPRKLAEEELVRAKERLEAMARATDDVVWDCDMQTDTVWRNANFPRLVKAAPGDLCEGVEAWWSRIHPEDSARIANSLYEVTSGAGETWSAEYRLRRGDGTWAIVHDRTWYHRDSNGKAVRAIGVISDITEQRRAEAELRRREEHFRALIENSSDIITVISGNGTILFQSPSVQRLTGWRPEEMLDTSVAGFVHPDDQAIVSESVARSMASPGVPVEVRLRFRHKDGSWRHLDAVGRSIAGESPDGYIVVNSRDVTERVKLEEQLLRTQRLESVGRLASGVAHDLNNILAPVLMVAGLLRNEVTSPEAKSMLDLVETSTRRGAGIVKQLLTFGRGTDGERVHTSLAPLCLDMQGLIRETFPRSIILRTDIDASAWPVLADATQIHQVLMNLCVNARDAMPDGGALTVSLQNREFSAAEAAAHPGARPERYTCLSVRDTGTGIPPEKLGSIFDPFFTTKEIGKGTGLGLSTVLGIIQSHGGFLIVDTEPGRGTCFQACLPAAACDTPAPAAAAPAPLPKASASRGNGELVLVVDDEEGLRRMTCQILERNGYKTIGAENGASGLAAYMAQRGKIRTVITDMMMPVMDGASLIRALRQTDPAVRVIAASGNQEECVECADAMPDATLAKPFDSRTLLETVQRMITATGRVALVN